MNCWETTFPNHNHVWLWAQIHCTAWFSAIHSWRKRRKYEWPVPHKHRLDHSLDHIWTTVSYSTNTNFHWWKLLSAPGKCTDSGFKFLSLFCSTRFYECPYDNLIWQWLSLTSPWRVNDDSPNQGRVDWDINFL